MSWADSCDDDYALDALKEEVADLKAENAELRKELAVTNPLFETLNAANDRLIYENDKLLELAVLNWEWAHSCCGNNCKMHTEECGYGIDRECNYEREIYDRMRELGVEV